MPRKADKNLEGRIVDAAYQLWTQGGEHALTMRAVARAAKTTTPTLYERFKDKHDLVVFLRERARTRMFQAVQPAKSAAEACELGLKFTLVHGNEYLLLASDWAQRLGRREPLPSYEFLKARLAEDLGGAPDNYARLALSLVALIHGTAIMILSEGVDVRVSRELEGACLEACRGLIEAPGNGYDGRVKDKGLGL
ncbi:MAG TPA: TetR family transcriptional regulator [Candidatus Acidoferrum sp.]|nr:TetR family transcriptional regulator [Candidatus Acidoferrum sp.]